MSNYAKHVLEQSRSFGPIENIMQALQHQHKENHLNTIEKFYIYAEFTNNNHLNDEHTISPNRIFDALLKNPKLHTKKNPPQHPKPHNNSTAIKSAL